MLDLVRCESCGALVADVRGPVHPYMTAAPGCWAIYSSLTDWCASQSGDDGIGIVQDLVDAYAVQHGANHQRRNRQSVATHLMSLCASLEEDWGSRHRRSHLGRWTHRDYPALEPRPTRFPVTAADVVATQLTDRRPVVVRMAATTWVAWADHHGTVRGWLAATGVVSDACHIPRPGGA